MRNPKETGITGNEHGVTLTINDLKREMNIIKGVKTYKDLGFKFKNQNGKKIPKHPEVLYTLTGDWKGWNDFLNISITDPEFSENVISDENDKDLFRGLVVYILENEVEIPEIQYERLCEQIVK